MKRKRTFGEKLTRELTIAGFKLALAVVAFWFCLSVLPDILYAMFMDTLATPPP